MPSVETGDNTCQIGVALGDNRLECSSPLVMVAFPHTPRPWLGGGLSFSPARHSTTALTGSWHAERNTAHGQHEERATGVWKGQHGANQQAGGGVRKVSQNCKPAQSPQNLLAARFSECCELLGLVVLHAPAKESP